ncbi:MAG: ATP-dependent RNA helicase RhlE [Kiritimatiellia bacterium]|jgi:ATP-dependent RNA helicase RhlE
MTHHQTRTPSKNRSKSPSRRPAQSDQPSTPEVDKSTDLPLQGVFKTLIPELQKALSREGYHTPTPIQAATIPLLLEERDIVGCAQTGTGKTAAFTLPILQTLHKDAYKSEPGHPQVLILAPTRELAAQIGDSIATYGRNLNLSHCVIFGGVNENPQIKILKRGVDIVVATPGRLLDLVQQRHLHLSDVDIFVLDEADRMLDMGFIRDIKKIIKELPEERWSLFFSATMPREVELLAKSMLHEPAHIAIEPEQPTVEKIEQQMMFVDKGDKDKLLASLFEDPDFDRVIVFTQMKHQANKVCENLEMVGVTAAAIHGNKSQAARTKSLDRFKTGQVRVLVATDIAARGIDVDGITHVINYDLPNEPETYVHRIGRTARAGAEGDSISFCSARERDYLRSIDKLLGKPVPVVMDHPYHSDTARNAVGAEAKPEPKAQRGGRGGGGGRGRQGGGASSGRGGGGHKPQNRRRSQGRRSSTGR